MHVDRQTGLVLLAMCAVAWFFLIPNYVIGHEQQVFPRIVLVLIAIPSLVMCIRTGPRKTAEPEDPAMARSRRVALVKIGVMGGAYLAYLLLIPVVGFFVSSFAATVGFLFYLDIRNVKTLTLVPLGLLGSIYVVMECFLNFNLPSGILF